MRAPLGALGGLAADGVALRTLTPGTYDAVQP
jgi:uncharacterized cupin superfamily protein